MHQKIKPRGYRPVKIPRKPGERRTIAELIEIAEPDRKCCKCCSCHK